nr:zinc finger, CCHC-type [Tanacetum cinerariifolium]
MIGHNENQGVVAIVGNTKSVGHAVQQTGVKCYNCNGFGHMAKECRARKREHEGSILFGLLGSRQQKFLVLRFFGVKEQQDIDSTTRVTSKSIGYFLESMVVDLIGWSDFQVAQRQLKDKQPEEKTNTDCLVKEQEKEYYLGERSRRVMFLILVIKEDTTRSTYLVNRSLSLAIGFKKAIDMLGGVFWYEFNPVLHGFEFKVKPLGDHTFEVERQKNVDQGAGLQEAEIWTTKGLMDKAKGNVLSMKIIRDQSDNTLRVSRSRFYTKKLVPTLLGGHSILSLKDSLSGDCDVEKNGKWSCIYAVGSQDYQMVCTRLDIASADVGMLDKFDRGLQTDVQVFVDFDYAWENRSLLWVDNSQGTGW